MRGDINIIVSKYASLKPKPSAHTRRTIKFVCCIKAITCAHRFGNSWFLCALLRVVC